jgi:hypothetical protein
LSFSFSHFLFVEVEVRERETLKSLSRLHCLVFFLLQKMPTRLPPPFPSLSSQFICPKCRRTNSSLDDGRSLELGLAENPSCCCCCSSCGFVFDADAISVDAGGNWRSSSSAYSGGFSQFDSLGAIAGSTRHNAATGNWVSDDGTAAGKASADLRRFFSSTYFFVLPLSRARVTLCKTIKKKLLLLSELSLQKASSSRPATGAHYRGNTTRYALGTRPKHAAAFAKLAELCGKVSAPRAVAESAKAMLRAVLSSASSSSSKAQASTAITTTPSHPPSLPHALLGGACLLLAARRERAALYPADVAAALAVGAPRLTRAAAAVAEAARASEGAAAPVGAEAFLRRELPGLVRAGSSNGAAALTSSASGFSPTPPPSPPPPPSSSSRSSFSSPSLSSQALEDAVTLVRWVEAGACPVRTPAHGPTLAAGASSLAAAGRGICLGGDALVAAAFRVASAAGVSRSEAALRQGLCRLAAARLPWLKKLRARDVEGHSRALLAAAREAAAEVAAEERRGRREEEEERLRLRLRLRANTVLDNDDDAALAAASASAAAKAATPVVGSTDDKEQQREVDEDELDVIREEDWSLYLRRPEEVVLAAVELAAREKSEAEAEEREASGVATPVQRPRKRVCFVK